MTMPQPCPWTFRYGVRSEAPITRPKLSDGCEGTGTWIVSSSSVDSYASDG
jgi:hypothetical protein